MKWKQFRQIAFPESLSLTESGRSPIWKANRWLGLRFGYIFYHLRLSANALSAARLAIAFLGFYLLSRADTGNVWEPILGLLLVGWQVNLDFADGVIARAQNKSSDLGEKLDGLANSASRAAVLILIGYFTQSSLGLWVSVFSGFVLSAFWDSTTALIFRTARWEGVRRLFRLSSSVVFVLIVLPFLVVLINTLGWPLRLFSCIITGCYAVLALSWLLVCCS